MTHAKQPIRRALAGLTLAAPAPARAAAPLHHPLAPLGETEQLADLLPDLAEFTLSPYLGAAHAGELAAGLRPA